ncbi:unnamed protein product [Rotaria sordida]|uniref:Uncharacterized protein n=1 Tax=Rotaria sordida TaxID=392033 RepID=A0A814SM88_9BILA|nr:unnamed protein product [Rotaria sordida]
MDPNILEISLICSSEASATQFAQNRGLRLNDQSIQSAQQPLGKCRLGTTNCSVNHSQNFVNPIDGTNTQRIEANWGWMKTKLIKSMRGTKDNLLPGHLAEYWWKGIHDESLFLDIIDEIRRQKPLQ